MTTIFGVSLNNLNHYHIKYLQKLYFKKEKTYSRVKELQSAINFFISCPESEDIGLQWRKTCAKSVNISLIIGALKHLGEILNIPLHRTCKTSYPVNVYISHYYNTLKPYLDTIQFINIPKNMELPISDDPFNNAVEYIKANGITRETVLYSSLVLASSISKFENTSIMHVAFYVNPSGDPSFIAFMKKMGKFIPISKSEFGDVFHEKSSNSSSFPQSPIGSLQESQKRLPSINSMLSEAGFSEADINTPVPLVLQGIVSPIFVC